jgi:hypothetical protein
MRAECQFAKAGQGLFYNGFLVDKDGHTFSFVYDCGTSGAAKILNDSVIEYKAFIKKRLDILFISHLHHDHVSHIPQLIEDVELNCVVLPNILPEIRLLLASCIDSIETNHELISLYNDPSNYFAERGANQVFLLSYDSENNEPLFPVEDDTQYGENYRNSSEGRNEIRFHSRGNMINEMSLFSALIKEYRGVTRFSIPHYTWEFRAVNVHYDKYDDDFLDEVRKLLAENKNDFRKILRNSGQVKKIRSIYENHFKGNLNDTSLVVRSRPIYRGYIIGENSEQNLCRNKSNDECREHCEKYGHAETLLLGDISWNFKAFDRLIYRHLKGISCLPRVIQLPHHGAKMRCHPMCCELFHHIGHRGRCSEYVASYGLTNQYGHPDFCWHKNCRDCCFDMYPLLRLVNERKDYSYTVMYEEKA